MTVVDGSAFRDLSGWKDQFGISGHPAAFPAPFAQGKWMTRKLAVPSSMAGKTVVRWDIAIENDYRQTELSAMYDNIVVRRNGRVVMVVYDGATRTLTLSTIRIKFPATARRSWTIDRSRLTNGADFSL